MYSVWNPFFFSLQATSPHQSQQSTVDVGQLHDPQTYTQHAIQVQHIQVTEPTAAAPSSSQVYFPIDDAEGWGDTWDHQINSWEFIILGLWDDLTIFVLYQFFCCPYFLCCYANILVLSYWLPRGALWYMILKSKQSSAFPFYRRRSVASVLGQGLWNKVRPVSWR